MRVARRLREWVAWTGDTQQALADRLGIHQTHLSRLVRGEHVNPNVRLVLAIERESAAWPGGPIRASEWQPAERKRRAKKSEAA